MISNQLDQSVSRRLAEERHEPHQDDTLHTCLTCHAEMLAWQREDHDQQGCAPKTVTVVSYEWRNWSRDIFTFSTREKAEQHVVEQAKEYCAADEIVTFDDALSALTRAEHVCHVDTLDVL